VFLTHGCAVPGFLIFSSVESNFCIPLLSRSLFLSLTPSSPERGLYHLLPPSIPWAFFILISVSARSGVGDLFLFQRDQWFPAGTPHSGNISHFFSLSFGARFSFPETPPVPFHHPCSVPILNFFPYTLFFLSPLVSIRNSGVYFLLPH